MIEILALSPLTNKELCSLAFECKAAHAYPVITWNVTFPTTPKPEPSPPQPPSVSSRSLRISPHDMKYVSVHSRLAHPLSTYSISPTSMSTSPTSLDHKQTALSRSAVVLANLVRICLFFLFSPPASLPPLSTWSCRRRLLVRPTLGSTVNHHSVRFDRGDYRNCDIPQWTAEAILTYAAQLEHVRQCSLHTLLHPSSHCDRSTSSTTLVTYPLTTSGISRATTSSTRSAPSTPCSVESFRTPLSTQPWATTKQVRRQ